MKRSIDSHYENSTNNTNSHPAIKSDQDDVTYSLNQLAIRMLWMLRKNMTEASFAKQIIWKINN